MTEQTWTTLMRRLTRGGFQRSFVERAILPDWWVEECERDPDLVWDLTLRVARFLSLPVAAIRDPRVDLRPRVNPDAPLRRGRDTPTERLAPAMFAALRIAGAVVRNLRDPMSPVRALPRDAIAWRSQLAESGSVTLDALLTDLWKRGIPVISVESLPSPSFQGLAGLVQGRPVIMLGHKHDDPGRVAFIIAHEAGHIAAGDCEQDCPVVDEQDEIIDHHDIEKQADRFAIRVLMGAKAVPDIQGADFRAIAKKAVDYERSTGADASVLIYSWARKSGDYSTATRAVAALYRSTGARDSLASQFDRAVDISAAPESDRCLLRCVRS